MAVAAGCVAQTVAGTIVGRAYVVWPDRSNPFHEPQHNYLSKLAGMRASKLFVTEILSGIL